jgi:hypothetical protein
MEREQQNREDTASIKITDLTITKGNVFLFIQGTHARRKIENKALDTLKKKDYHFNHNFGPGKKPLLKISRQRRMD